MKNIYYLFVLAALCSCNQTQISELKDNRPKDELAFIKEFSTADSIYNDQKNEITKKDAFDSSKVKISHFILKKLNAKAENWQAVIQSIQVDQLDGAIDVELMISKGLHFDEEHPEFNSIILKSHIFDNDKIKNMLKPFEAGDKALVTGIFSIDKDLEGNIDFGAYVGGTFRDEGVLNNPAFNFNITDIKKQKDISKL